VQRRLLDPDFRDRLDAVRRETLARVTDIFTTNLFEAASRLLRAVASDDDDVAIRAADVMIKHGIHLHELRDIAGRLADLQARVAARE
jgi:hypothetical protein